MALFSMHYYNKRMNEIWKEKWRGIGMSLKAGLRRVFPADRKTIRDGLCLGSIVTAMLWFPFPQLLDWLTDGMSRSQRLTFWIVALLLYVLLVVCLLLLSKKQRKEGRDKRKTGYDERTGWYSLPFLIVGVPLLLFWQRGSRNYGLGCLCTGLLILIIQVASVKGAEE